MLQGKITRLEHLVDLAVQEREALVGENLLHLFEHVKEDIGPRTLLGMIRGRVLQLAQSFAANPQEFILDALIALRLLADSENNIEDLLAEALACCFPVDHPVEITQGLVEVDECLCLVKLFVVVLEDHV